MNQKNENLIKGKLLKYAIYSVLLLASVTTLFAIIKKPFDPPYKNKTTLIIKDASGNMVYNAHIKITENDSVIYSSISTEIKNLSLAFLPFPIQDKWCLEIVHEDYDTLNVCDFATKLKSESKMSLEAYLIPKPISAALRCSIETRLDSGYLIITDELVALKDLKEESKSSPGLTIFKNMRKSEALSSPSSGSSYKERDYEMAYTSESEYSDSDIKYVGSGSKAGTLTAGELNDFNKFDMWEDLSENQFNEYKEHWGLAFTKRFAVVLRNGENGAVIQAQVNLVDESDRVIWTAITNNAGRCELWNTALANATKTNKTKLVIHYAGQSFQVNNPVEYENGINQINIPVGCYMPNAVDIAFVIDATGSMGDEIEYLKTELLDVIEGSKKENPEVTIKTASIFYRDVGDEYLVRHSDFDENPNTTLEFIKSQTAGGGGDMPEGVDTALNLAINGLNWTSETRNKLLFLVLDAPPHSDEVSKKKVQNAIKMAAAKGIRIIPIVCSGHNKSNEYLMRSAALATNGTYIFLTDHSGVGGGHITPTTDEFDVTYLNALMKDVIIRFTDAASCANDELKGENLQKTIIDYVLANDSLKAKYGNKALPKVIELPLVISETNVEVQEKEPYESPLDSLNEGLKIELYPNPTHDILNISFNKSIDRIILMDGAGQMLREYQAKGNSFSISVGEYADGIYFIGLIDEQGNMKTERFILRK